MRRAAGDFEEAIIKLEAEIEEFSSLSEEPSKELDKLEKKLARLQEKVYKNLTAWQKTLMSRHPDRPYTLDYIDILFENFLEIHGDRRFADDPAIIAGLAFFKGEPIAIVGHQKGRNMKQKLKRNFGMANPEGYRKALRIMKLAEKFNRPVISFVDTPGAHPGIGAEERGQAEAIAYNLREMSRLKVPIIVIIIGEGGSGGALGIAVGNQVLMLEYSIYSVISPESCSAILWKDQDHIQEAAENLHLTAQDLKKFGLIDKIVPEPMGGAQANSEEMAKTLETNIITCLNELKHMSPDDLIRDRMEKFRKMGAFHQAHP
jgi:acetyl-CoA carboxylase carboxyl transferase subunit alpha